MLRLHTQVKNVLSKMEACYEKLAQSLSQATVAPDSVDENLVHAQFIKPVMPTILALIVTPFVI